MFIWFNYVGINVVYFFVFIIFFFGKNVDWVFFFDWYVYIKYLFVVNFFWVDFYMFSSIGVIIVKFINKFYIVFGLKF